MTNTKLILLEGIPGSGKSSAGAFLERMLAEHGKRVTFWQEGNFDHPADFEGVARLAQADYQDLLARYPRLAALIPQYLTVRGADYLLSYRKLQHLHPQDVPRGLVEELSRSDVYDGLPVEEYRRLALDRWRDFTHSAKGSDEVSIFECCFLQNPLTVMLARHNTDPQAARQQIMEISNIIQDLSPSVIYLAPQDVRTALEHVRGERPKEWADFVTWYLTGQEYGKAHHIRGYEGVIQFYEMRQELELELLKELPVPSLVLEHSGQEWDRVNEEIRNFIRPNL